MSSTSVLRERLTSAVGDRHVLTAESELAGYTRDWTGHWLGSAAAVVRPGSTAEVAQVMRVCVRHRIGVVVQGGNTGLAGGATPIAGEVVLDTTRMSQIDAVDRVAHQVTAGAGATLEQVQTHARITGLDFPVDLAARSQATIGGMVATNAGGALAMRYGMTRANVVGLEAVLGDGRVISRLSGLLKDNAGYDIPSLLIGSEGTLAVVTRVRLSLVRRPAATTVALIGIGDYAEAVACVSRLRDELGPALEAADFIDRPGLELVCERLNIRDPFESRYGIYVVLQVAADDNPTEMLAAALDDASLDATAVGRDARGRAALWAYREAINDVVTTYRRVTEFDVSVPLPQLAEFAGAVATGITLLDGGATMTCCGHLGDGNLHIIVLDAQTSPAALGEVVAGLVGRHGGSISAEHGIGLAKRDLLSVTRSEDEIGVMRALKVALDPHGTLGRDRVLRAG